MKQMKHTFLSFVAALTLAASLPAGGYTLRRVSVHDPSVVWEPNTKYYYIFGSHRAAARTKDLMSWASLTPSWGTVNASGATVGGATNERAFVDNQTKTVVVGGVEKELVFDAQAWSAAYGNGYSVDGNMWAPDVIYNPVMKKWCMYLSINGPTWNSSIILLTSNSITGPYVYQAPVVISGFNVGGGAAVSYKKTDLELAIGTQAVCPSRYTAYWGNRWPHCIDPCVFYDEDGRLWMSYGSWSGGIWMLQLNEETGLRDYDVKYPSTNGNSDGVTSDPYFGKKVAGGFYASGEGSYIEHIGDYYYLFVSNGGLAAGGDPDDYNNGGYQMRVFRSKNPNGPYVDGSGRSAVLTARETNFGPNSSTRGMNIFGAYGEWGYELANDGDRSQGHNSIIAAEDGRTYLVYHTRFQNGGEFFQVRVHQVFQNIDGWLVAAPFEYTGEAVKSADIATTQQVAFDRIPGDYQLLIHRYGLDHRKKELATPVSITLNSDGTISGDLTGKWELKDGTSYITVTIGSTSYNGVMVEQTMEPKTTRTVAFTAMSRAGVAVWGYRSGDNPTSVKGIDNSQLTIDNSQFTIDNSTVYDLRGRRVGATSGKGIYIINGKKVIR